MSDINEIKRIVNESRVNGVYNWNLETIASLITTIESQSDEIAKLHGALNFHRTRDVAIEIAKKDTLIESQKEEIEQLEEERDQALRDYESACIMSSDNSRAALKLSDELESLKAITELAVKGLKQICYIANNGTESFDVADSTLSEIERLQNGTT